MTVDWSKVAPGTLIRIAKTTHCGMPAGVYRYAHSHVISGAYCVLLEHPDGGWFASENPLWTDYTEPGKRYWWVDAQHCELSATASTTNWLEAIEALTQELRVQRERADRAEKLAIDLYRHARVTCVVGDYYVTWDNYNMPADWRGTLTAWIERHGP